MTPSALIDGTRTVTASVSDPAGNPGTDTQALTIDTVAPTVTIAGGATALTNDATPNISGTANVAPGTTVTVTLADETLTGVVQSDGAWAVTAAALSDAPHRVVMSTSDAAGNTGSVTQTLSVDTVSPVVAITGGATATTNDVDPTIAGTSNAAPGTTVTVSIAGQTMTTLVQPNGTWNTTASFVGDGTWAVVASAPDPAGNVGSGGQDLTIVTGTVQTVAPVVAVTSVPTPGAGVGSRTTAAATTTVARDTSQKVRSFPLSIGTKVTASAAGRVVATANGTVKIKGVKKAIRLTNATATIAAGQTKTLKLRPKGPKNAVAAAFKKIKTATRNGKKVTATITVKVIDDAGNTRQVKRTVKLTR